MKNNLKHSFYLKPLGWWCSLFHRTAYVDEERREGSIRWSIIRCKQCKIWYCVKSKNIFTGDPGEIWLGYAGDMTLKQNE